MALREVNLIPAEILYARRVARRIRMWGALMIALPALIWGTYGISAVRILAQRQAPHDLSGSRKDYGLTVAEVSRLEQELTETLQVQELFHTRAYSEILGALAEMIPEEIQVATCSIQPNPSGGNEWRLVLTGLSSSHSVLGGFVKLLEEHTTFTDVAMTLSRAPQSPGVPSEVTEKPSSGYRIECAVQVSEDSA